MKTRRKIVQDWDKPAVKPSFPPDTLRILKVWYDDDELHFEGQSTWQRREGIWTCVSTDDHPCVKWMRGLGPLEAKHQLAKRALQWTWMM